MGLGKTFTHSIAREIGRNYEKSSNYLLGDKHSTPIRMVGGSQDVSRKRGRVYHNDFDKAIQKFEIKGGQATFNQVLNIHSEYFSLVEEANADNVIDLNEMSFLVEQLPKGISVLERAKSALIDLEKQDFADKTQEKIDTLKEFMKSLDSALKIEDLPSTKFNPIICLFFFLSFIGIDRLYFKPKDFWSYFYAVLIYTPFAWYKFTSPYTSDNFYAEYDMGILMIIFSTFIMVSSMVWYDIKYIKEWWYWGYMKNKNNQREMNESAKSIKVFIKQQIAKY